MRALAHVLALVVLGCKSIEVKKATPRDQYGLERHTVLDGGDASQFTLNILARRGLLERHQTETIAVIETLDREMRETHDRTLALAIAELATLQLQRSDDAEHRASSTAVRYSYAFLFDPQPGPAPSAFDARFRDACDFYDFAFAAILRAKPEEIRHTERIWKLAWYTGETTARVTDNEFPASCGEMTRMRIAADYRVKGIIPPDRGSGLGVPCLLDRATHQAVTDKARKAELLRYFPESASLGATVLVRWPDDASILDEPAAPGAVEVLDPMDTTAITIANRQVPIEIDFTTPIAELAARTSGDQEGGLTALLHVNEYQERIGLYMFQPYHADRITVLFVHGLAPGPETWLPLYNQLLADPTIRTRYQFLFWFYPTGQTALASAAQLRHALVEAHKAYGNDTPLDEGPGMVVCAHSLGGILASTLIVDSGDTLWNTVFIVPPDKLPVDAELRTKLTEGLIFERLPSIRRVIYYSTPHRGAPEASTGFMQWASGLIHLPQDMMLKNAHINKYMHKDVQVTHHTVAQSLIAHNPVLVNLADLPVPESVPYHSIIGNEKEAGAAGGTDGLVPYWSSHLDGAESELIILSGHSTEHKPEAARETRRILLEHLAQSAAPTPTPAR